MYSTPNRVDLFVINYSWESHLFSEREYSTFRQVNSRTRTCRKSRVEISWEFKQQPALYIPQELLLEIELSSKNEKILNLDSSFSPSGINFSNDDLPLEAVVTEIDIKDEPVDDFEIEEINFDHERIMDETCKHETISESDRLQVCPATRTYYEEKIRELGNSNRKVHFLN